MVLFYETLHHKLVPSILREDFPHWWLMLLWFYNLLSNVIIVMLNLYVPLQTSENHLGSVEQQIEAL